MTARDELIAKLEARLPYLMDRIQFHAGFPQIEFHASTRQALIDEADRVQAEIDEMRGRAGEDALVLAWNVNEANEGQD